jgi:putative ABC transport system ATP-binding protein
VTAAEAEPFVRVRDVFKIYREGEIETVALRGADLELTRGTITSLTGPSGSGKSTLLALIAGLSRPSAGQVLIDGRDIGRADEAERSRMRGERMGIVFQSGNLLPFLSALENVRIVMTFGKVRGDESHARGLLEATGVGELADRLPRQLSGGEAQRVAIAVALANSPELLIADELTGELDSATATAVLDLLVRLKEERGLTILLVTHNRDIAARADRQLTVADGRVTGA